MKMKKKGKVYPSPPLPSSSTHHDSLSVLKLLPTTILVLVSVLSVEDKEVLAYLITRGTTRETSNSNSKKKNNKHKPPVFDCECFDCYTNYWFRWDTSPNRELIHEIIEAFEEHHLAGENPSSSCNNNNNKSKRGKKKEKVTRCVLEVEVEPVVLESVQHVSSPERLSEADVEKEGKEEEEETVGMLPVAVTGHKGLVRKVLPDVLGLFNSSFWRLWNPNA